jgi:hypothetical protein
VREEDRYLVRSSMDAYKQQARRRGAADEGSILGRLTRMWSSARLRLPQAEGEKSLRFTQGSQRACVR